MSFIETPRFPESISAGSRFGPGYSTALARNLGGYEVNNQNWSMPLYEGDVSHAVKTQAQLDELLAFFHGVAGRHNGFRFQAKNDYTATGAQGTLTAIDATHWQMTKTYTYGGVSMARKITKPVASTIVIAGGGTYSLAATTGIITKTAGAAPTSWTGEFDFPVRFDTDKMLPTWLQIEMFAWTSIPIIEIRI